MDVINQGYIACSTNNYTTVIWYHICAVCNVCGLRSSWFESTGVCILHLLVAPPCRNWWCSNKNSCKSFVPVCKKDTRHKESQLILEPPNCVIIIIPPASTKLKGGYTGITLSVCPSVRLWTESCPLCIFNNTHRIHFIFAHLIKQLQKVCRV